MATVQKSGKVFPSRERVLKETKKMMDDPVIMAAIREAEEKIK